MSVIVMGVEMPDCCEKCPFLDYEQGYCFASGKKQKDGWYDCNLYVSDNEKRHKDCPLRPLPEKHGRLIDADALKKTFRDAMDDCEGDFKRKEDAEEVRRWVELLCRDFDAQPTIVEAEGE